MAVVHYQGSGEDPTHGEGLSIATLIRNLRKTRGRNIVTLTLPREKTQEAIALLEKEFGAQDVIIR